MPKIKTKASAKKRFKIGSNRNVIATQANKRHNMMRKSGRQLRNQRGTVMLKNIESCRVKGYLPNSL